MLYDIYTTGFDGQIPSRGEPWERDTSCNTSLQPKTQQLSSIALWSSPSKDEGHLPRPCESGSSYFAHENMAATKSTHPDGRS